MKMSKTMKIVLILLLATVVLAAVHLNTRVSVKKGTLLVNGVEKSLSDFKLQTVEGTLINGKGEKQAISGQGVPISAVIPEDFTTALFTASDEFSAELLPEDAGNAFLVFAEDDTVQLVVFGDSNSKRNVRNLARIETH